MKTRVALPAQAEGKDTEETGEGRVTEFSEGEVRFKGPNGGKVWKRSDGTALLRIGIHVELSAKQSNKN